MDVAMSADFSFVQCQLLADSMLVILTSTTTDANTLQLSPRRSTHCALTTPQTLHSTMAWSLYDA